MIQPQFTLLLILAVFSSKSWQYELGTTYSYEYLTAVLMNEPAPLSGSNSSKVKGTDVGYQITASVDLTSVWQDPHDPTHILLELLMNNPKLSIQTRKAHTPDGFAGHASLLDEMQNTEPIFLDWFDGKIKRIFLAKSESLSLKNIKKGIASLFQFQSTGTAVKELDTSGSCLATYKVMEKKTMLKRKSNCQHFKPTKSFARKEEILGVSSVTNYTTKYTLKGDSKIIDMLTSTELHSLRVHLRSQTGASIVSRQSINLKKETTAGKKYGSSTVAQVIELASKNRGNELVEDVLQVEEEPIICHASSCKALAEAVQQAAKQLHSSQLATTAAAKAFVALVPVVRQSSKSDILKVLLDKANKANLPQLVDVVAAAQTVESHEAIIEVVKFHLKDYDELAERYLTSVSLSTRPSEYLLQDILKLLKEKIKNEKLQETALLSLASITKTFSSQSKNPAEPIVVKIRQYFLDNLNVCSTEPCRQQYLRVLKNLAMPDTVSIILKHVDSTDKKTSVSAVKALTAMPPHVIDSHVKSKLENVYFQIGRRYDSSARTLALDILLKHQPETEFLRNVLESLTSKYALEISTYTLQRLVEFAGKCPTIRSQIQQILAADLSISNYHTFSQNGKSTAFSRDLYRNINGNGTFSSSTEAVGGTMKRSSFDVHLGKDSDSLHLLSFGIFTGGLSSFVSSSSSDGDEADEEDATAGMEITLGGVQLRPMVFFEGQGELMGHVWSGTASERTSALQATILLHDHQQTILLQNGFPVFFDLLSSISFDFGGEIQISLWNRNSHSVVDNVAAMNLDGSLSLANPLIQSRVEFTVGARAKIDFVTDVSFADGLLLCLRMGQNRFVVDSVTQKHESIPGSRHWIHKKKSRQEIIPGRTYALNGKNSLLCNEMFPK